MWVCKECCEASEVVSKICTEYEGWLSLAIVLVVDERMMRLFCPSMIVIITLFSGFPQGQPGALGEQAPSGAIFPGPTGLNCCQAVRSSRALPLRLLFLDDSDIYIYTNVGEFTEEIEKQLRMCRTCLAAGRHIEKWWLVVRFQGGWDSSYSTLHSPHLHAKIIIMHG